MMRQMIPHGRFNKTLFLVTVIYLVFYVFVLPVYSSWYIGSVELLVVTFSGRMPCPVSFIGIFLVHWT